MATRRWGPLMATLAAGACLWAVGSLAHAQGGVDRSRDRGPGIPVSQFGTYVPQGTLVLYGYWEYYHDNNAEYAPADYGYGLERDFRGRYRAHEGLLYLAYGISDRLAVELEAAAITARLDKAPEDTSAQPARLQQSGLGDVEGQLRWRWRRETKSGPEVFSYFETVFPLQDRYSLIGTTSWEFTLGTGVVRGFRWGTVTLRAAVGWAEGSPEPGEYAVEYLKRISPGLRVYAAVEGSEDEMELLSEAQVFLRPNILLKLNNAIGLTSKAPDWAPEVGLMIFLR